MINKYLFRTQGDSYATEPLIARKSSLSLPQEWYRIAPRSLLKIAYFTLVFLSLFIHDGKYILQATPLETSEDALEDAPGLIYRYELTGPISPAAMEGLEKAIGLAEQDKAKALMLIIDTPGGLLSSMDAMIRSIYASSVPILSYVYPPGATCGSAGVYIMYASHVAAMSLATNIGSATPVSMGIAPMQKDDKDSAHDKEDKRRKLINHTLAQIRSYAQYRGRSLEFAKKAITEAENFTAKEAYDVGAIDFLADNEVDLLRRAHAKQVKVQGELVKLSLENAQIKNIEKDFRQSILEILSHPNLASILIMLGFLGIFIEIFNPGLIFPGTLGAIAFLVGLYGVQGVPVAFAGVSLIALAFVLFLLEVYIMSYGLLSVGGLAALLTGALMLARSGDEFSQKSLGLVLGAGLTISAMAITVSYLAIKTLRKRAYVSDKDFEEATVQTRTCISKTQGTVDYQGEIWQARLEESAKIEEIHENQTVVIKKREGLILYVSPRTFSTLKQKSVSQ